VGPLGRCRRIARFIARCVAGYVAGYVVSYVASYVVSCVVSYVASCVASFVDRRLADRRLIGRRAGPVPLAGNPRPTAARRDRRPRRGPTPGRLLVLLCRRVSGGHV
jgi:hypothetical protein